jgi:putative molybdopterin biosynthesis protein
VAPEALLTTGEVAALLRVHPKQVYRLLRKGLPGRRVGVEWRFHRGEVLAWAGGRPAPESDEAPPRPVGSDGRAPSLVAANGDVSIEILLRLARGAGEPLLGLVLADAGEGAALLARGAVLAAGAHAGAFPSHVGPDRAARIHLVTREVGLVGPRGAAPPSVEALAGVRLASRPPTAGVRAHLDRALAAAGLDPAALHARALLLRSHLEVATAVAAGRADAGIASSAWAERLGLAFRPIAREAYGLVVRARDLGDARLVRICEVAQSAPFRREAGAVAGYDATGAGDVRYDARDAT